MRIIDYFRQGAQCDPQGIAFVDDAGSLSWAEAQLRVEELAAALAGAGLAAGDKIGVYSPNDRLAFIAILAAFRLGAVWVPINARNSKTANEHWLGLSGCQALFYHSTLESDALALAPVLCEPRLMICIDGKGTGGAPSQEEFSARGWVAAPEPPDGADVIANVFPTGGTTGLSKAAQWSLDTWETLVDTFWQNLASTGTPESERDTSAGSHSAGCWNRR